MARTVRDANHETRSVRLRPLIRSEPCWRGLESGFPLSRWPFVQLLRVVAPGTMQRIARAMGRESDNG
jgi:hypothetical protein